ncbi:hypothetical protein GYA54_01095 [Candidatus Kuenenbacteria bacterium]|nr:hypothetical protein [Candidatus Kuenenbacteria bacterium]
MEDYDYQYEEENDKRVTRFRFFKKASVVFGVLTAVAICLAVIGVALNISWLCLIIIISLLLVFFLLSIGCAFLAGKKMAVLNCRT